jgi:hypothetical protein
MALIKWLVCILQVHRAGSALSMAGIWYVYFDLRAFFVAGMRLNLEHCV